MNLSLDILKYQNLSKILCSKYCPKNILSDWPSAAAAWLAIELRGEASMLIAEAEYWGDAHGPIPTLFETGLGGRGGDGMRSDRCGQAVLGTIEEFPLSISDGPGSERWVTEISATHHFKPDPSVTDCEIL